MYRDQGKGRGGQGKEVCDGLVVFENHVIIISDKDCKFRDSGNVDLDWSRWYRRAIESSAAQLYGAMRWLRDFPDRLFTDPACRVPLPVKMPAVDRMKVHLVLVAHGVDREVRKRFGGSGSLMINPLVVGRDHQKKTADGGRPFMVGKVDETKPYIHILDDESVVTVLDTLDTVADLVRYLSRKEELIETGRLASAAGEEEILAVYLANADEDGQHAFPFPDGVRAAITEGFWTDFERSAQRRAQKAANEVSYFWDSLVERFTHHLLTGTSDYLSHPDVEEQEVGLRFFAREDRTRRRMLAREILDAVWTTPSDQRRIRVIFPSKAGDPYWLFLLMPSFRDWTYEVYRDRRRQHLEDCCRVLKLKCPDALDIVGLATESGRRVGGSEDFIYMDVREWTKEADDEARELQRELGILLNPTRSEGKEREYPWA